ncbi:DUF397 domain-containing protein [Streptomyces sp. NPDC060223]|uniref:DUF397 domain-containing protein n=1 Tax=unclassified Streptomyces TaxID=2593676 RepID=UPI00364485F1
MEIADGIPGIVPVRDSKAPDGPALAFAAETWAAFTGELNGISWRKSSYSNQEGGNCVEVAAGLPGLVPVRDSKAPDGPALAFAAASWALFIGELKTRHRI